MLTRTVLFEEAFLAILPAVLFIVLAPFQAAKLVRRRIRLRRNAVYLYKLLAICVYTVLQLTLLVLVSKEADSRNSIVVASAAVSLFQGVSLGVLSHFEHVKSIRPSFLITSYLIATVLLDAARIRTRWLGRDEAVAGVLTASLGVKCVIVALEAIDKRQLFGHHESISSESTSGFISRSLFLWLNPLLAVGYKNVLSSDDLPQINENLDSEILGQGLQRAWEKCEYACVLAVP